MAAGPACRNYLAMIAENIHLVQIIHPQQGRSVAFVQDEELNLLNNTASVYQLVLDAIQAGEKIKTVIEARLSGHRLNYNAVYEGSDEWRLLPSFDHPENPFACLVSGTGLTHKNSALHRQMMH